MGRRASRVQLVFVAGALLAFLIGQIALANPSNPGPRATASAKLPQQVKKLKKRIARLEKLKQRIARLESLNPRVAALEGKPSPTSLPPSGPAGGILSGNYPNPTIGVDQFTEPPLGGSNSDCSPTIATTSWGNVDSSTRSVFGYYRDPFGTVHLKGNVRCFSGVDQIGDKIFQLPLGYRPALTEEFATVADSPPRVLNSIVVESTGVINPGAATGVGDFISLDGISFGCAPSGQNGCP